MAKIICPKCECIFENNNKESMVTRAVAAGISATGGATLGASIGIVGGPLGGISGAVPGAFIGGALGWFTVGQFRRCPNCKRAFKT